MSLRVCTLGSGGTIGMLLLTIVAAGDVSPVAAARATPTRGQPTVARPPAGILALADYPASQPAETPPARSTRAAAPQVLPRVTVRDLRYLAGLYALDDEHETFERYLRFRGLLLEQGFPTTPDGAGDAWWRGDPYRSYARDYIGVSEYERFRHQRDRQRREMEVRKVRLLTQHEQALQSGLRLLGAAETDRAVVALTLAAKLNQADPACRIHLAQARLAQGHYLEGALALRRALQLQPNLLYADLHLDTYYKDPGALDRYTDKLAAWVAENDARPEVHFLLGFLEFQRGRFAAAHAAFTRAAEGMPQDELTQDCLRITKPAEK